MSRELTSIAFRNSVLFQSVDRNRSQGMLVIVPVLVLGGPVLVNIPVEKNSKPTRTEKKGLRVKESATDTAGASCYERGPCEMAWTSSAYRLPVVRYLVKNVGISTEYRT